MGTMANHRMTDNYARATPHAAGVAHHRALDSVLNVLTTVIFLAAVAFTVVVVATTLVSGAGEASLFGWKPYVVLSDSMQKDFQVGDIAVTHRVDPATLAPGDIIAFESVDPNSYGEVFTHKIREVIEYEGEQAFTTYGTTTGDNDEYPALASRVQGKFAFSIPKAGYVFDFFKSPMGYVVLVLIPFSVLIGLQIRNIVRLLREGNDRQAAALASERERMADIQAELDRLRQREAARHTDSEVMSPASPVAASSAVVPPVLQGAQEPGRHFKR